MTCSFQYLIVKIYDTGNRVVHIHYSVALLSQPQFTLTFHYSFSADVEKTFLLEINSEKSFCITHLRN